MTETILYKGDCLKELSKLKDNSVDMILTDLPYGTTACKWDSIINLDKLWDQYLRVARDDAAIVLHAQQPFTTTLASSKIDIFKYEWIWEKPQGTNPLNAKIMPLKSHENILVFYQKKPTYNPQKWYSTPYSGFKSNKKGLGEVYGENTKSIHRDNPTGERYPKTVLKFKQETGLHPTQKPVELEKYLIKTYTNEFETVLDSTMGSGTTGVACVETKRNFIGIELDDEYFKLAKNRIKEAKLKPVQTELKL